MTEEDDKFHEHHVAASEAEGFGVGDTHAAQIAEFRDSQNVSVYQSVAAHTAVYPDAMTGQVLYPVLGLLSEVGEVVEKLLGSDGIGRDLSKFLHLVNYTCAAAGEIKKAFRDDGGVVSQDRYERVDNLFEEVRDQADRLVKVRAFKYEVRLPVLAVPPGVVDGLRKELGGVCYYVAQTCTELDTSLGGVMYANAVQLKGRKDRGVLGGSGDDR